MSWFERPYVGRRMQGAYATYCGAVAGAVKAVRAVLADVKRDPFTQAMEAINTPENKANVFFKDEGGG